MLGYELKKIPQDFQVHEVANFSYEPNNIGPYYYYLLSKSGFTTFEAIEMLENYYGLPPSSICYSGLKDEDAVTTQYISISNYISGENVSKFNTAFQALGDKYINLQFLGSGQESLKIAKLLGNCFRLKVRNLTSDFVNKFKTHKEHISYFLNYYGNQRFGLPNQIKNTHLIGKAILAKEYDIAMQELLKQKSASQQLAKNYLGQPEIFFSMLEKRQVAFFQSAYYSYLWNQEILNYLEQMQLCSDILLVDGAPFKFLQNKNDYINFLKKYPLSENTRVVYEDNAFKKILHYRPTVIQFKVIVDKTVPDTLNDGRYSCDISFFLQSGSYATIAVAQFLKLNCLEKTQSLVTIE